MLYDHKCNSTFAHRRNVIDNVRANNGFLIEIMLILKANPVSKGHMISIILHLWSFHERPVS